MLCASIGYVDCMPGSFKRTAQSNQSVGGHSTTNRSSDESIYFWI
jgi:hypothetical protein